MFRVHPRETGRIRVVALTFALALLVAVGASRAQTEAHVQYERALALFEAGDPAGAVIEIKNALQADPGYLPAHLLLGRVYLRLGIPGAAQVAIRKSQELGADRTLILPLRARALLQLGRHEDVLSEVDPGAAVEKSLRSELLVFRGHAQAALGQNKEAERSYLEASRLSPLAAEPRIASAKLALARGDLFVAERRAHRAAQVVPDAAAAWSVKGDVLQAGGDLEAALEAYDAALAIEPSGLHDRTSRIGVLLALKRLDAARAALDELESQLPSEPRVHYLRSMLHAASNDPKAAARAFARVDEELSKLDDATVRRSGQLMMLAAMTSLRSGRLETARSYLAEYISRYPGRLDAREMMATVQLRQGRAREAVQELEALLENVRPTATLLARLAEGYSAEGRHRLAHQRLQEALALKPHSAAIRAQNALNLLQVGDTETAVQEMEALFRESPRAHVGLGARLAAHYINGGESAEALRITRQLVRIDARSAEYLNLHGTALARTGDRAGSRMAFEGAMGLEPGHVTSRVNAAKILIAEDRTDQALALLREGLGRGDSDARLMVELSRLEEERGNAEDALRWLLKARDAAPKSETVLAALAYHHLRSERSKEALAVSTEALHVLPDSVLLMRLAARAHLALGDRDAAVMLYSRMSRAAGRDVRAQFSIADLQRAAGELEEAAFTLAKALKVHPQHLPSRMMRIEILQQLGELTQALADAEGLARQWPDDARVLALTGRVLTASGAHEQAVQMLRRALALLPAGPQVIALSRALAASGATQEARSELEDWLAGNPGDAQVAAELAHHHLSLGEFDAARRFFERARDNGMETPAVLNNLAYVLGQLGEPGAVELARQAHAAR
jgi:putative PEP-CTERM system TPR-repeat lipoprotein